MQETTAPPSPTILTGNERVDVSGFGGHIRSTDLTHLYQQSCHIIIERREGLAESHQTWQGWHEEGKTLGTIQH